MRLKTVSAPTLPEAMETIRQTLGEEAVIVSSLRMPGGDIRLIVAVGDTAEDKRLETVLQKTDNDPCTDKLRTLLTLHRVPELLIQRILKTVITNTETRSDIRTALTNAFQTLFTFAPIAPVKTKRAFLMTGLPAGGKTIALVKWAVSAALQKTKVCIMTLDTQKAGALAGLQAYTDLLNIPLVSVTMDTLPETVNTYRQTSDLILIDSAGLNPWMATDMATLTHINHACQGIEPVLVMPAGTDSVEAGEIASIFSGFGCTRLITTRLDTSRTFGNILNAAYAGSLSLANFSTTPTAADALRSYDAETLADILINTPLSQELFS